MTKLTDCELAEKVAVEVMGWEKTIQGDNELAYTTKGNLAESRTFLRDQWKPCNDWNDCMESLKALSDGELTKLQDILEPIFARYNLFELRKRIDPRRLTEFVLEAKGIDLNER